MTKFSNKPKAKIYIDGANIFYTQKKLGWSLDWQKVKDYLNQKWDVVDYRYYIGLKQGDDKIRNYLKYLDYLDITVISKPLKVIKISKNHHQSQLHNYKEVYKCNFDVEISTDISFDRTKIDEIILFSGDSDFKYLVEKIKTVGKRFIIFSSRKTISWELKLVASEYYFIEDFEKELRRQK